MSALTAPDRNGHAEPPPHRPLNAMPVLMIALAMIDFPSNPINDVDWGQVERLVAGYDRGDPIPPITIFPVGSERYEAVFGQHRLHARRRAGKTDIAAIVLPERPDPLQVLALQFRENHNHRELSGLERAEAFYRAKEIGKLTSKAVAALFGVSEGTVSRDLTQKNLHPSLRDAPLCPRARYAVARLPQDQQPAFYEQHKGTTAEAIADAVSDRLTVLAGGKPKKPKPVKFKTPHGIVITVPGGMDYDLALADLAIPPQAVKRAQKEGLPMATIPLFMRNPT